MKELPILFSTPMVRAILEGRKSQTRRVVKPQPPADWLILQQEGQYRLYETMRGEYDGPYWKGVQHGGVDCPWTIGDLLWTRETFVLENTDELPRHGRAHRVLGKGEWCEGGPYLVPHYRATEPEPHIVPFELGNSSDDRTRWSPSVHMPKWAARIWLEVTDVRVRRVLEITQADIVAEGIVVTREDDVCVGSYPMYPFRAKFRDTWNSIYAKKGYGWDKNPWVWVIEFKRIER